MSKDLSTLVKWALQRHLFLIVLQWLFNELSPDLNADAFRTLDASSQYGVLDRCVLVW